MTGALRQLGGQALHGRTPDGRRMVVDEIWLDPRTHGRGRVPGQRARRFRLDAFVQAIADRDLDRQLAYYRPDADIRVVDPDHPPVRPRMVRGRSAIAAWLLECGGDDPDLDVIHLVDGGDRIAFSQRWHNREGKAVIGTSTAELEDGLITTQHTIQLWARSRT